MSLAVRGEDSKVDYAVSAGETTVGWENVDSSRCEFPPAKVVWRAPQVGWLVEREGEAEGSVDITNGMVVIRKTSEKGRIIVTAPGFKVGRGQVLRFFVDVSGKTDFPMGARGYLATWGRERKISSLDRVSQKCGWFISGGVHMTEILNSAPGMTWRKYRHLEPDGEEAHVAIVIEGHVSESVWTGLSAEDFDAAQAAWMKHFDKTNLPDRSSDLLPEDAFERNLSADIDHTARIVTKDGVSRLEVDGKFMPPIIYKAPGHIGAKQADRMCYAGKPLQRAGVRIGVAQCRFGDLPEYPGFWTKRGFDVQGAVRAIRDQMRAGDESLFVLTLNVTAYPEFTIEEHPDEVWLNEDGTKPLGNSGSIIPDLYNDGGLADRNERRWPWVSPASPSWRKAVKERIGELFAELRRTGLMKRVIGVHIAGYHDTQFAMPIPDFSPTAKADYKNYLSENGIAPFVREGTYTFYSKQMGWRVIEDFSREAKKLAGKPIIASRWVMSPFLMSFDVTSFVKSDAVDVIVPQPEYSKRLPGLAQGIRLPAESFHRHGKMQLFELDLRTYAACDIWAKSVIAAKGLNTAQDIGMWRTILRKHVGVLAAHRMGWWFYDMAGGWYSPDEIVDDVADVRRLLMQIDAEPIDPWHPDVALVIDESALATYGTKDGPDVQRRETLANRQWSKSALSGVPYDAYLAQDFYDNPLLARRYKAIVWSGFCEPDARQRGLMDAAARMGTKSFVVQPGGFEGAFLNAFAHEAGAFVACLPNRMQVDMNGNFLSLHCIIPGPCDIRLPFDAVVTNLKDSSTLVGSQMRVSLSAGETCWFLLKRR